MLQKHNNSTSLYTCTIQLVSPQPNLPPLPGVRYCKQRVMENKQQTKKKSFDTQAAPRQYARAYSILIAFLYHKNQYLQFLFLLPTLPRSPFGFTYQLTILNVFFYKKYQPIALRTRRRMKGRATSTTEAYILEFFRAAINESEVDTKHKAKSTYQQVSHFNRTPLVRKKNTNKIGISI